MSEPTTAKPQTPTVSPQLIRQLPVAIVVTLLVVAAVFAAVVLLAHRSDWWPAYGFATAAGLICAIVSGMIILSSAGKPADYVVTMMMLLAGVRVGISVIGLIVGVKVLALPPVITAMMICGYYAAMLIVESLLVRRALNGPATTSTDTLRGNQG